MSLPYDLKQLLGDVEPDAYAQLNSGIGNPTGETHLVVVNGQLRVFTRESLIGEFKGVEIDPAQPPRLEKGGFADTLHVALKDGESHDFNVGSFERDGIVAVLDAMSDQVATTEPEPPQEPAKEEPDAFAFEPLVSQEQESPPPSPPIESPLVEPVTEEPVTEEETGPVEHQHHRREDDEDLQGTRDVKGTEVKQRDGSVLYRSNDPGCLGCLLQFILFAGGVTGFWFLHVLAMENAVAYFGWGRLDPEGGAWVGTKIVALICGAYVGGKLAGVVSKLAKAQIWGGAVLFKDGLMVVFGPKGKWHKRFFLDQNIEWECRWHTASPEGDNDNRRAYQVVVEFKQDGTSASLRTNFSAKQVNFHVRNMTYTKLEDPPPNEGTVTLDTNTFRKVIRAVAEDKGWKS